MTFYKQLSNNQIPPQVEWEPTEKRECRFVFIGRNLDKKELVDGVMACKV